MGGEVSKKDKEEDKKSQKKRNGCKSTHKRRIPLQSIHLVHGKGKKKEERKGKKKRGTNSLSKRLKKTYLFWLCPQTKKKGA